MTTLRPDEVEARADIEHAEHYLPDEGQRILKKALSLLCARLEEARRDESIARELAHALERDLAQARQAGGHAQNCRCCEEVYERLGHDPDMKDFCGCGVIRECHPYRDPRCAPATLTIVPDVFSPAGCDGFRATPATAAHSPMCGTWHEPPRPCDCRDATAGEPSEAVKRAHEALSDVIEACLRIHTQEELEALSKRYHALIDAIPVARRGEMPGEGK